MALALWFLARARPPARLRLQQHAAGRRAQDGRRHAVRGRRRRLRLRPRACGSRGAPPGWTRSNAIARRLAPLCLAAFVPLLLHWQLWTGPREMTFAVLASAFGLALQALMRVALAAPPLLPAPLRARLDAARADVAAAARARALAAGGDRRDRRAPPRDLLLDHHDPEPLHDADGRLRPGHREQPGLERRPLERAAVQDVRADGRPDRDAHRSSPDVHLVSDRHPLPAGARARRRCWCCSRC